MERGRDRLDLKRRELQRQTASRKGIIFREERGVGSRFAHRSRGVKPKDGGGRLARRLTKKLGVAKTGRDEGW